MELFSGLLFSILGARDSDDYIAPVSFTVR
jgi:hypothetical protein